MELSEKQKRFNSLRLEIRQTEGDKFERTCDCGETVWYEYECLALYSRVDIHFSHGQKNTDSEAKIGSVANEYFAFARRGVRLIPQKVGANRQTVTGIGRLRLVTLWLNCPQTFPAQNLLYGGASNI